MRRRVGLFLVVGLVLPLVVAASASGQGAVLEVSPKTARPGEEIAVAGRGFSSAAGSSSVFIRLSTRTGPSLRSVGPDPAGNINDTFFLPTTLTPGWYLVLATQTFSNGRERAFTPGRARILVQGSPVDAAAAPGGDDGSTSPLALPAVILASILLLGAGATLLARRRWTPNRPRLGS